MTDEFILTHRERRVLARVADKYLRAELRRIDELAAAQRREQAAAAALSQRLSDLLSAPNGRRNPHGEV